MEIKGKLQQLFPVQEGQGKNGTWKKQEFLIETLDNYPKKICMSAWGDKADELSRYKLGDVIVCSLDISSREYNGKWYTDIRAWRLQGEGAVVNNAGGNNNSYTPFSNNNGGNNSTPNNFQPGISVDSNVPDANWEGDLPF